MLEKNSPKPLYQQLKDILVDAIDSEKWKANEKIPSENEKFETECGGYTFRILSVSGKMIQKVLVFKNSKTGDDNEAH